MRLNDFRKITLNDNGKNRPIKAADYNNWHETEKKFIKDQIELAKISVLVNEYSR